MLLDPHPSQLFSLWETRLQVNFVLQCISNSQWDVEAKSYRETPYFAGK